MRDRDIQTWIEEVEVAGEEETDEEDQYDEHGHVKDF